MNIYLMKKSEFEKIQRTEGFTAQINYKKGCFKAAKEMIEKIEAIKYPDTSPLIEADFEIKTTERNLLYE